MAAPNSSFSEILSTTIDNYSSTMRDNVLNHNALLVRLNRKGNATPASGGVKLLENLMYADNGKTVAA
jgi:hypothetical protein